MKEYMLTGLVLSALIAIAGALVYSKDYEKVSRLAMSAVLLFAITAPVSSLVRDIMELDGYDFTFEKIDGEEAEYEKTAEHAFASGIAGAISEKFNIPKEHISVTLVGFSVSEMRAESILVLLSGRGVFADTGAIERYMEGSGLGECEVQINVG